ncbi:peptidylprolyl isomerase [Stenotrophomonas ginsengisoli]|uniref:peptidylprolyl isomerase n=1 Tax=Stenotrophomonas ginsengisoli TaxID=336566 RepID=A0A0R0DIG6_9GAMM|nr:peptidylprolyl isomerase [Stenotrophomonas ginsengisoli]KRG77363.1 peptidylprolyl isomerase [Stenotrophomonas ginsengisoli]
MSTTRPRLSILSLAAALLLAHPLAASANEEQPAARSAAEIIAAAPDSDWRTPDPDNLLYMTLPTGLVVFELAPQFAPRHVANIRQLARQGFWDNTSVYRVQDNFVAQFGDIHGEDADKRKPLGAADVALPAEFEVPSASVQFSALPDADGWSDAAGFVDGFAAARDNRSATIWMAHCYGMLGAGRNNAPDSSQAAELYVVTGQAPRNLDRNMSSVGRVIHGIERLSALPRGPEPMGFYEDRGQDTPILKVRLGSDVPADERLPLQLLRTDSASFAAATEARRNRRDAFYVRPAGHIDLCNVPLPVRLKS